MIRVGVLSDTHLPDTGEALAFLLDLAERHFQGVEAILHAGDVVAPGVLAAFAPTPVYAVRGNMDPAMHDFPQKRLLKIAGIRIGLIHGWGPREGLVERVRNEFRNLPLDCLVFGHSHVPMCHRESGLLLFNPGSAVDRRGMPYESVGLLEIEDGTISAQIVPLEQVK
ncbi:MAG: metallophosphatase family protein [Desulfuromonadales bacterium]|nr:metallophosphatase family protein [Desulfuromonadales bacterium]